MIRELPKQEVQVRTGPVKFGDDWPGVFIRGDTAVGFLDALNSDFIPNQLLELLASCHVKEK